MLFTKSQGQEFTELVGAGWAFSVNCWDSRASTHLCHHICCACTGMSVLDYLEVSCDCICGCTSRSCGAESIMSEEVRSGDCQASCNGGEDLSGRSQSIQSEDGSMSASWWVLKITGWLFILEVLFIQETLFSLIPWLWLFWYYLYLRCWLWGYNKH